MFPRSSSSSCSHYTDLSILAGTLSHSVKRTEGLFCVYQESSSLNIRAVKVISNVSCGEKYEKDILF